MIKEKLKEKEKANKKIIHKYVLLKASSKKEEKIVKYKRKMKKYNYLANGHQATQKLTNIKNKKIRKI